MDTKDLRCFRQVYEDRSINQAAKQLFITPQGLSRIITKLEEELQARLFERTPMGWCQQKVDTIFMSTALKFFID